MNHIPNQLYDDGDQDIQELFLKTLPRSCPVDVASLQSRLAPSQANFSSFKSPFWKKHMTMKIGFAASAIAASILFLVIASNVLLAPSVAFAQVKAVVEASQSVQYIESQIQSPPNPKAKNQAQKNAEESIESPVESIARELEDDGNFPRHVKILGRFKKRTEVDRNGHLTVEICDMEKGQVVKLDPKAKVAKYFKRQLLINEVSGKINETDIKPNVSADLYSTMRSVPDDAKRLPEGKAIDGVQAIGFRTESITGSDTWTRTIWVDPVTKLPVQIESQYRSTNPMHESADWILSDFKFDAPLDEALFSTETPEGYESVDSIILGITAD